MSFNSKFLYVENNPINYIDPDGKVRMYGNYCGDFKGEGEPINNIDSSCKRHDSETGDKIAHHPDHVRPFYKAKGDLKMALDMISPKAIFADPFNPIPWKNSIIVSQVFFVGSFALVTWNIHYGIILSLGRLLKKIF